MSDSQAALTRAHEHALAFLRALPDRPVGPSASFEELVSALGGALPDGPRDPSTVIDDLVERLTPGLLAVGGPRYFGFVIGGGAACPPRGGWRRFSRAR